MALGHQDLEGNQEGADDEPVEVFSGVGFASRPSADSTAEGVVAHIGARGNHPVLIATRDEDLRKAVLGDLEAGETAIFSAGGATAVLTKDGDVRITAAPGREVIIDDGAGGTEALVRKSDFDGHTHLPGTFANSGGAVTGESRPAPPPPLAPTC